MNKAKLVIFFTLLMCIAPNSYAACKASISLGSECKGEEGYIHIPKDYKQKSNNPVCGKKYQIFKGNELPKVGSVAHSTEVLMFYQNLDHINLGITNLSQIPPSLQRRGGGGALRSTSLSVPLWRLLLRCANFLP